MGRIDYHGPDIETYVTQRPIDATSWQHRLYKFVEGAVLIAYFLTFGIFAIGIGFLLVTGNHAAGRDIIAFWAAGQQIVHHANPYDAASILAIERSAGYPTAAATLIMRNPPSAMVLAAPLGLFRLFTASLVWSVALLAAFLLSVHLLWLEHGRPHNKIHLLGYSFAPAIGCVMGGQSALFALLGLVLFLRLYSRRPFLAGLSLWLCALKPHLLLPFALVLLIWIAVSRSYRVLAGAILAISASSLIAWHLDPSIWSQYQALLRSPGVQGEYIPCLSIALRFAIAPSRMIVQYLPAAAGCIWAVAYYWKRRATWDWMQDGALLMLVSFLVSPYAWLSDQTVLLPALLLCAYRATTKPQLGVLMAGSAFIEIAQLAQKSMHSSIYLWMPAMWLIWYLYVSWKASPAQTQDALAPTGPLSVNSAA